MIMLTAQQHWARSVQMNAADSRMLRQTVVIIPARDEENSIGLVLADLLCNSS